jgi:hypothetical protein
VLVSQKVTEATAGGLAGVLGLCSCRLTHLVGVRPPALFFAVLAQGPLFPLPQHSPRGSSLQGSDGATLALLRQRGLFCFMVALLMLVGWWVHELPADGFNHLADFGPRYVLSFGKYWTAIQHDFEGPHRRIQNIPLFEGVKVLILGRFDRNVILRRFIPPNLDSRKLFANIFGHYVTHTIYIRGRCVHT